MYDIFSTPDPVKPKFSKAVRAVNAFVRKEVEKGGGKNFRPSEIGYLCPREYVFRYFMPLERGVGEIENLLYLQTGETLHELVQNKILGPMGLLWGEWVNSDSQVTGYCPGPEYTYVEPAFKKPIIGHDGQISGKLDGLIDRNRYEWLLNGCVGTPPKEHEEKYLWEIKVTNSRNFEQIKTPKDISDGYKMQTEMYQHMMGIKKTIFWFFERDSFRRAFIEYDYTGEWWKHSINKIDASVRGIEDKVLPVQYTPCDSKDCSRAKKCPYSKQCFSGKKLVEILGENSG